MPKRSPTSHPLPRIGSSPRLLHPSQTSPSVEALLQRVRAASIHALTPQEVHLLQRVVGNRVVQRIFAGTTWICSQEMSPIWEETPQREQAMPSS